MPAASATPAVHLALFLVQLAFASNAIVGKRAVSEQHVDPSALAFLRAAGGAVAFHAAALYVTHVAGRSKRKGKGEREGDRDRASTTALGTQDHLRFALFAILGVVINQAFFLHGLKRSTATSTALLAAAIPVFTAAIAAAFGVEKLRVRTVLGLALASVGVVTLTGVRDLSIGNLLVTINSLSYAAYLVGVRPLLRKHGTLRTVAWVFTWGALLLAPFGLLAALRDIPTWSTTATWLVLWCLAVPTVFAYLANAYALARASSGLVAAYIYLQPLLVTTSAYFLLHEALTTRVVLAGVAILVGLGVVATRSTRVTPDDERKVEVDSGK